jgi:teichuronic acid biosynthesis glycosyltransferase TuaH
VIGLRAAKKTDAPRLQAHSGLWCGITGPGAFQACLELPERLRCVLLVKKRDAVSHYIVSGANWDENLPHMRRNRLALYLQEAASTHCVYWIGVTPIGVRRFLRDRQQLRLNTRRLSNGIQQVSLPDFRGWLRYGRRGHAWIRRYVDPFLADVYPKYLWYTNPSYPLLAGLSCWEKVVYDCSDYWCRPPTHRRKSGSERRIAERSDILFGTSTFLIELLRRRYRRDAVLIENGVDYGAFAEVPAVELPSIPRPRLGFIGALKPFVDYRLLVETVKRFEQVSLVLMGPVVESQNAGLQELLGFPRVHYLPAVASSAAPGYMKALDVGLCPYRRDDNFTAGQFPLKFFEYLAAGIPVVGHGLPATTQYAEEGVYHCAEGYDGFLSGVARALAVTARPELVERRRHYARQHDWSAKFAVMLRMALAEEPA